MSPFEDFFIKLLLIFIIYANSWSLTKNNKTHRELINAIFSILNALQCVYMVFYYFDNNYLNLLYTGNEYVVNSLFWFASYLFIDGSFKVKSVITNCDTKGITSLLHHFVGGLGIFMIAYNRKGLGLGIYFAFTELSTPFLNLSWLAHSHNFKYAKLLFILFYITFLLCRIVTIPWLIYYLIHNYSLIETLPWYDYSMVYGGCLTLIFLNIIWFIMLSKMIRKQFILN